MRERKRQPNHPGIILKELYIDPLELSITNFAKRLHISRKTLSKIINCRGTITPEMALRLSKALSTTPELWINIQRDYDLWYAENELDSWRKVEPITEHALA